MDEIEQLMSQLKQGLSQHVFYHFQQLKQYVSEEDAAKIVTEELEKIEGLFESASPQSSLFSSLSDLEKTWKDKNLKAIKLKEYDDIYESEDILNAIKLIKASLKGMS